MNSTEETSLIHRLNQPEYQRQAFEQLVNLYSPQLYRQIRRMVYSHDDTNDILQNTVYQSLGQFRHLPAAMPSEYVALPYCHQ